MVTAFSESGPPYVQEMEAAILAVSEAARLCQRIQPGHGSALKHDRSPVTVADFGSQATICRMLRTRYPDDPIMAEEDASALRMPTGSFLRKEVVRRVRELYRNAHVKDILDWIDYGSTRAYRDRFWTLDPVDGTKGFLGGRQYAIALALIVDGRVRAAALACPNLTEFPGGSVYAAREGGGAFRLALRAEAARETVGVTHVANAAKARFCESFEAAHTAIDVSARVARKLGIATPSFRIDSQAKYAIVARGDAEIYLRLPSNSGYVEKIWDHAAGSLILTEAGGTVTDVVGLPLDFSTGSRLIGNRGVVATNGILHLAILDALPYK